MIPGVHAINHGDEPLVETLSDAEVLALCDSQMDRGLQEELSDLLAAQARDWHEMPMLPV